MHGDTLIVFRGEELARRAGVMGCDDSFVPQLHTLVVLGAVARVQDTHLAVMRQVSLHQFNLIGKVAHLCNRINTHSR